MQKYHCGLDDILSSDALRAAVQMRSKSNLSKQIWDISGFLLPLVLSNSQKKCCKGRSVRESFV